MPDPWTPVASRVSAAGELPARTRLVSTICLPLALDAGLSGGAFLPALRAFAQAGFGWSGRIFFPRRPRQTATRHPIVRRSEIPRLLLSAHNSDETRLCASKY